MIRQAELDSIALALEGTMPDLCDVYRRTGNPDEYGGAGDFVKIMDGIKVGIEPIDFFRPQQVGEIAGKQTDVAYYSMAFPRGTLLREGDHVDIYTRGAVIAVMRVERTESWDTMLHCDGSVVDDSGWYSLNFHAGGHS